MLESVIWKIITSALSSSKTDCGTGKSNVGLYDAYFKVNYLRDGYKCTQYIECKRLIQEEIDRICSLQGDEMNEWLRGKIPDELHVTGTIRLECKKKDY